MTYEEIKTRLIKIESMLQSIQEPTYQVKAGINVQETTKKLVVLKEQLQNKLTILESGDKTAFVNGQATEYTDEKELAKLILAITWRHPAISGGNSLLCPAEQDQEA